MTDITIPPAALEAGARAITMALILAVEEDCRALALTDDERTELARAACLAMLQAWPDARMRTTFLPNDDGVWIVPQRMWSLPLPPQENPDDKA